MTLEQLKEIKEKTDRGELQSPPDTVYVNNHIHTTYSFSPYSPTKALYMAWQNGLKTAGIMDHDSVGGAKEFLKAAEIIEDGRIDAFVKDRYASYNDGIGKKIVEGNVTLEELAAYAEEMGAPALPSSGRQEYLQSIVNAVMFG